MAHHHDPFSPAAAVAPVRGKKAQPTKDAAQQVQEAAVPSPVVEPVTVPAPAENGVPQGTVAELSDWVGDDKMRAQQVLDAEEATGEPRRGLVRRMQEIIG